ncbi:helix-turn-helix domain-containing protein [Kitasatospora sp. NPDC001119]
MSTDFERLAARDQTLAAMIQCWRERTDPNSIPGLVTTPGRRTRELTKTEVAKLAGISVKWYSKLENGEPAQFSDAILDRLAFTFRLNDAERLALYHHATGRAPAPRDTEPDAMAAMDADMQR